MKLAPHWPLHRPGRAGSEPDAGPVAPEPCAACGAARSEEAARLGVCDACGHHARRTARQTIAHLADPGSFRETDSRLVSRDPLGFVDDQSYHDRLIELRERTGETDAIITGVARIGGQEVVLAVLDFAFLGGSMGVVVGEKIARAANRAARKKRPLVTVVASGGARMQEGMLSLLQMAKTTAAIKRLKDQGEPYVSVLTNPTTGGVFASFASMGDLVIAEPGALIGFAGPRVAEQAMGRKLPPGAHTAEFLLAHGMIDAIVDRRELPARLATALRVLAAPRGDFPKMTPPPPPAEPDEPVDPWRVVQAARDPERPTSLDYIQRMLDPFVELHGDRAGADDPAVVAGVGLLGGQALAVVALERGHGPTAEARRGGRARPAGYRKAQRVMRLAARLGMPVLSLIDTPGAYPGVESEEGGLAAQLAESMALMSDLPTPTVAAVVGEGGSGGALALAVADRVLMQQNAVYSVIAPEGAATILFRDAERAQELTERLKITAPELRKLGLVDAVVPEPAPSAAADPDEAARLLAQAVGAALADLARRPTRKLLQDRWNRYQAVGREHAGELSRLPFRRPRPTEPAKRPEAEKAEA